MPRQTSPSRKVKMPYLQNSSIGKLVPTTKLGKLVTTSYSNQGPILCQSLLQAKKWFPRLIYAILLSQSKFRFITTLLACSFNLKTSLTESPIVPSLTFWKSDIDLTYKKLAPYRYPFPKGYRSYFTWFYVSPVKSEGVNSMCVTVWGGSSSLPVWENGKIKSIYSYRNECASRVQERNALFLSRRITLTVDASLNHNNSYCPSLRSCKSIKSKHLWSSSPITRGKKCQVGHYQLFSKIHTPVS